MTDPTMSRVRCHDRLIVCRSFVSILLPLALVCTRMWPAVAQTPTPTSLTIEEAIQRTLDANPTIAAARQRRLMSLAELDVARERLNPELRAELERETPKEAYGLAVPLELGGKRGRRIAVGEASVRTSEAELSLAIAEIRTSVRRAYFARLIAEARLTLHEELQALALRTRDAAQQRFDAGSAPRLEVLEAELALAESNNQVGGARGAVVASRASLNALLALPLDAQISLTTPLEGGLGTVAETALVRARSASAELALLDRRIDEQRARVALARSLQTPDVIPEAVLTRRAEPEFNTGWRAAVGITVPLFTRHRAGVRLAEATLTELSLEREATLVRISGDVTSAAVIADAQRQQYMRYRDQIIPQALEVERLAEDSYRLGQTGLAAFLQAVLASREVRLRSIQSAADLQTALADLERSIGAPLP